MRISIRALIVIVSAAWTLTARAQDEKPKAPESSARKAALKDVRELFEDEYRKRDASSRRRLAAKLLEQGESSRGDAVSSFVFLDEARTLAMEAGDVATAFRAVDLMAGFFDLEASKGVDSALEMKMDVLSKAQRLARDAGAARTVAKGYLTVARQSASEGDFKIAQDAVKKSSSLARKARDRGLAAEAADFSKAVPELKKEFGEFSKADLSTAIDIGDTKKNLAVGRYLCFVKGDWDRGLERLQWSGKGPLSDAAKMELEKPEDGPAQVAVAEAWWSLGEKERNPLHQKRYLTRAKSWYERAYDASTGITRAKIDKRLESLETLAPGSVNLLRLIDPEKDGVEGAWAFDGRVLMCPKGRGVRLQIPYEPPAEYDLIVESTGVDGKCCLYAGLVESNRQFMALLNSANGDASGLERVDNKPCHDNETTWKGAAISNGKKSTTVFSVRKGGVRVTVDEKVIIDWSGPYNRLTLTQEFNVPNPKALFIGGWESSHRISKLILAPVSGQGKRTR